MPRAVRGTVYWYDFGDIVGNELSGRRPALILSNDSINQQLGVAIAAPMSSTAPITKHLGNHVYVQSSGSWASVRQVKTVDQRMLGQILGEARPAELQDVLVILAGRLGGRVARSHDIGIAEGEVWAVALGNRDGETETRQLLVLDYNPSNGMAITMDVEMDEDRQSPVRVQLTLESTEQKASGLVHRIKSLDLGHRSAQRTGTLDRTNLDRAYQALLKAVDL